MANINCNACEELRQLDPELVVKGWSNTECTSFKNDTGLKPSSGHNDCTDLEMMNDCLIGNLDADLEKYDVCDWKKFMHRMLSNLWTVLTAIKCALCGIWTNIHNLWTKINEILEELTRHWNKITEILNDLVQVWNNIRTINSTITTLQCYTNFLLSSRNMSALIDESNFVPGTAVSFDRQDDKAILPSLVISGSTYTISGSIRVHLTNSHWDDLGTNNNGGTVSGNKLNVRGGYTLCVVKIPKADFPWLGGLASCVGSFVNSGISELFIQVRGEGDTYPGQWGDDSADVTVPAGQIHIRVALAGLTTWGNEYNASDDYADVTFRATGLAYINPQGIVC